MVASDSRSRVNKTLPHTLLVVAAALTGDDGRVLIQQRPPDRAHAGLWEFPGGKVEPAEAPEAALVRELAEELGIVVAPGDLVPVAFVTAPAGARALLLLLYRIDRWKGQPRALDAAALAWVYPRDLPDWPMPPADYPLGAHLLGPCGHDA